MESCCFCFSGSRVVRNPYKDDFGSCWSQNESLILSIVDPGKDTVPGTVVMPGMHEDGGEDCLENCLAVLQFSVLRYDTVHRTGLPESWVISLINCKH